MSVLCTWWAYGTQRVGGGRSIEAPYVKQYNYLVYCIPLNEIMYLYGSCIILNYTLIHKIVKKETTSFEGMQIRQTPVMNMK